VSGIAQMPDTILKIDRGAGEQTVNGRNIWEQHRSAVISYASELDDGSLWTNGTSAAG
jgi:hypothetical protein